MKKSKINSNSESDSESDPDSDSEFSEKDNEEEMVLSQFRIDNSLDFENSKKSEYDDISVVYNTPSDFYEDTIEEEEKGKEEEEEKKGEEKDPLILDYEKGKEISLF